MATYNRPGVYVNELPLSAAPVNSAAAANAAGAVIAAFPQGPDNVTLVTSWYDFTKKFGGYSKAFPATFSVGSFFKNGGTELYVKRILPASAKKVAKVNIPAGVAVNTVAASKYSITSNVVTLTTAAHRIQASDQSITLAHFADTALNGTYDILSKTTTQVTFALTHADTAGTATVTAASATGGVVTYTATNTFKKGQVVTITGLDTAAFNLTSATIDTVSGTQFTVVNAATGTAVTGQTASASVTADVPVSAGTLAWSGVATNDVVTIAAKHRGVDGNNIRVVFTPSKTVSDAGYYDLSVFFEAGVKDTIVNGIVTANSGDDVLVEQFNGITLSDPTSGDYIVSVLEFGSTYIRALEGAVVEYDENGDVVDPEVTYVVDGTDPVSTGVVYPLSGATPGTDVSLTYADYTGDIVFDPFAQTGTYVNSNSLNWAEFEQIDRPLVIFLPDVTALVAGSSLETPGGWDLSKYVYQSIIDWVEAPQTNGRHFVVVETSAGLDVAGAMGESGSLPVSSRAAVYYPHIYITDPLGRSGAAVRKIGASGSVAGQFLATDQKIGPFKTPAGIDNKIVDAIALERAFSSADLDALNSGVTPAGVRTGVNVVNAIRNIPGAGIVIMGGRTLKQDGTANRYVSMRRSLTYLEKRLNDIASFAVFENNTEQLWARLITVIGGFLNEYRNQGGLRGTTVDASFYIKCDEENNTPTTIQAGEVHVEVGVALEYPAEFVVINLSQKTAE